MSDKKILCILIIAFLICSILVTAANDTASIHGAVYDWDTFSPLENVIVEVNSTPSQSILAKYGLYSFNLPPGDYLITAKYYSNQTLVYYTEEEITISDNGDYVLDLLLTPTYLPGTFNENDFSELEEIAALAEDEKGEGYVSLLAFALAAIAVLGLYFYTKGKNRGGEVVLVEQPEVHDVQAESMPDYPVADDQSLPDDLQEMLAIIASSGGRMTQKELRTKVKYSEAKVSLMVSDLEDRGIVRKFRKGRGNVIVLEGYE
ncbi:hypothetical protein V7O66_01210 [Methanolobus sp. ZRKC3]|uniref:DUF7343 domain-containing protein n=1 Tax=Methanolobus sp. ZRKC3 TaxID=3125786 RepID=UPI00325431D4